MSARLKVVGRFAPYQIEKGIPMPVARSRRSEAGETMRRMAVGDSFLIPLDARWPARDKYDLQRRVSQMANTIFGKGGYSVRTDGETAVRVWRLK